MLIRRLDHGCGNHGCRIKKPEGMATNGPCQCSPSKIARELRFIAESLELQRVWPEGGPK